MKKTPEIVHELREQEKQGALKTLPPKQLFKDTENELATHFSTNTSKIEELFNLETQYRTIFENYAIAITIADEHEHIFSWNNYAEKLLNMTEKELFHLPVKNLYPPEEWQRIRNEDVRKKGIKYRMETRLKPKNKPILDIELSLCILRGSGGKTVGSVGIIKDISKLKQTEKQLTEVENRYRTIFENSAVAITLSDANERIISWNTYAEHLLDMTPEELYNKPVHSLYPPEEWKKIRAENVRDKGMQHHLETKIKRKHNTLLDVDISLSVIKNSEGNIIGSIGIIKDISQQKETERRIKTLLENADDAIYLIDKQYEYLLVNNAFLKQINLTKKAVIGKKIDQIHPPEISKELKTTLATVFKHKKPYRDEQKQGNTWYQRNFSPVTDNLTREITAVLVIARDITARKKVEESIKRSEERFKLLYEKAPVSFHTLTPDGIISNVNEKWCQILGYTPEEVIGKTIFDFIEEEEQTQAKKSFNKKIASQEAYPGGNERCFLTKTGKKRTFVIHDFFSYSQDNKINFIHTAMEDFTEYRKVLNDLIKSEEKYRILAETSADGVFTTDPLGRLTYVNPSMEKLLGRRKGHILATPFREYLGKSSIYLFQQTMLDIRKQNEKLEGIEFEVVHENGYIIPVEANISPLLKEGMFIGIEGAIRDISERKKVEQELKKSEKLRTEFMNIAAHELKSPVTPIRGYLELIESDKEASDRIKNWARIGLRNADRVLRLVNDILDVSRLDSDTMRFNMEKIKILELLNDIGEDFRPAIEQRNLKFIEEHPESLPTIFGDKFRLSQVLKNLFDNALKFTDTGSITLHTEVDSKFLYISVIDTGIGISNDETRRVFSKFYQSYTGEDRRNQGTGLGLFICKEILRKHNGDIWVTSEVGKGSSFTMKIPIWKK